MLNAPNFQWRSTDPYRELDRGTGAWGVKDVTPGVPEIIVATEDFETDPISGSGTWTISLLTPHTGLRCLRSGVIIANQDTDYTFNIPATATAVRFWWRVSSENNFDWFRVYKDAIIPGNLLMQASGLTDTYEQATLDITGATTVTFRYIKDGSASAGLDRAIIDDIEWIIPGTPAIQLYEPFHLNEDNCVKVVLCDNEVTVTGTVETRLLSCETDSVTVCLEDPVVVTGVVETRPLTCETDSVSVCFDDPLSITGIVQVEGEVSVTGEVNTRPLTCETDAITACINEPISITGTVDVNVVNDPLDVSVLGTVSFVPGRRSLRGLYYASSGAVAYTSAADGATGGDIWIVNTSPTVVAYIREVRFTSNIAALALLTALPRIQMERMTFTGAPSGPQITPARRDSTDPANTATVRTTNAGMVISTGAIIKSFAPPSSDVVGGLLAANASSSVPVEQVFVGDIDSFIVLRQNEGVVFRQATAGSLTENRQYNVDFIWEEI